MSKHKSIEDYLGELKIEKEQLQGKNEAAITALVREKFGKLYNKTLASKYPGSEAQLDLLTEARDALLENPQRLEEYLRGNLVQGEEKGELVESKLGALWNLADSVDNEYTGKVVRTTASGVEVEIRQTCLVPISQTDDGSVEVVVQIGDEVTTRIRPTGNPGQIDVTLIAVNSVPVAAPHRQPTPVEVTGTKPDVQPPKDNRGVGGKQPRQPVPEKVNKGDAPLPGWVRVWGGLWCVIIPCLTLYTYVISSANRHDEIESSVIMLSWMLAIPGFCIWVGKTLSIEEVPVKTRVGVVFKVIVAMLAAFTLFGLIGSLLAYYLGYY